MTKFLQSRIRLASGLLLLQAGVCAAPVSESSFTSTVAATPAAKAGRPVALSVRLADKSIALPGGNVDLEIYNAQNKRVAQQVWAGQTLAKGKSSVYRWAWKPAAAGTYTAKLGVFSGNWKTLHYWVDKALTLKVS